MAEKQQRKSVRDEFAEKVINILESDQPLEWTKGWSTGGFSLPYNGQTGRHYNGINLTAYTNGLQRCPDAEKENCGDY